MKILQILLLVGISFSLSSQDKYPSLLWKIEGKNLDKPSYLYGTMHVSSKIAFNLSDDFFDALKDVDAIALETNPEFWLSYYRDSGLIEVAEHFYQRDNSSNVSGFYEKFTTSNESNLDLIKSLFKSQEPMLNQLLFRYNYGQENYEETTYLDMFIFQSAKKSGKPIYSLEDFLESHFLSERSSLPDEDEDDGSPTKPIDLETAYLERNLDLIDSLITKNYSKNYRKYLLTIRNDNMVNALDSLMPNESIFAGVGAAHLPGEEGMIQMLIDKGYKVTPAEFEKSKKGKRAFNKIKTSAVDIKTEKVTSKDQRIVFEAPGSFYPQSTSYKSGGISTYFSPDYANGSYYSYERLPKDFITKKALDKKSINYIDSVLYLVVPGSIQKNKSTSISGYPAIMVETELSRGNQMKALCIDTPQEIIVLKTEGNKSFIKSRNVKQFFKSVEVNKGSSLDDLNKSGISIDLPDGSYQKSYDDFVSVAVGFENNQYFGYKSAQLLDFDNLEQDEFELNYLVDEFSENHDFEVDNKQIDGKRITAKLIDEENNRALFIHYKIHHNKYFQLLADADEESANKFFASLKIEEPKDDVIKTESVNDTVRGFQVKTFPENGLNPVIYSEFKLLIEDFEAAMAKEDSLSRDFEGDTDQKIYKNPLNGEGVSVYYNKVNKYFPLWNWKKTLKEQLTKEEEDLDMLTVLIREEKDDTLYVIEYDYIKEGTSRKIRNKAFIIEDRYFNVAISYDSIIGMSEFSSNFLESFQPYRLHADSADFKSNPCLTFFKDLSSEKYQLKEQSKESIDVLRLDTICQSAFIDAMNNEKLNNDIKEDLLYLAESVFDEDKDAYLAFLINFYEENKHTPGLQSLTLQFIGRVGNEQSAKKFMELLAENPPILRSDYDAFRLFKGFSDSNELISPIISDLQKFAIEYDEFMPRAIYFTDRVVYKELLQADKVEKNFLDAIEKRGKKAVRKMAYANSEKNNEYKKQRDELVQIMSIIHCVPEAEKKYEDIIAITDTITNKRFRAHLLGKRINRKCPYSSEEVDAVIADTNEVAPFFQWISGGGYKDSIFKAHGVDQSLVYWSHLIQQSGYDTDKTEISFLDSSFVETFKEEGWVYVYKVKTEFGGKQLKGIYFANGADEELKVYDLETKTIRYDDDDEVEEMKAKLLKKIQNVNRPRIVEQSPWGNFGV